MLKPKTTANSNNFHHDHKSVTYVTSSRCYKVAPCLAVFHSGRAGTLKLDFKTSYRNSIGKYI